MNKERKARYDRAACKGVTNESNKEKARLVKLHVATRSEPSSSARLLMMGQGSEERNVAKIVYHVRQMLGICVQT